MMKRIGLTGGIGSGKSTIAQLFTTLGVPVYNCDSRAKQLMDSDADIQRSLIEIIGKNAIVDGVVDRKMMASVIFNDKEKLESVNKLIHPAVGRDFQKWSEEMASEGKSYVICEAALMVGTEMEPYMDKIIAVSVPMEERIERTMQRDNASREMVIERISNQLSDDEIVAKADFVVCPDDKHFIINDVLNIHEKLTAWAS
ncbi:MAG: dephospho-CoA kinase [Bacteroidales bacterium]|jgi:dephospho-CoA kinase|nr:dephospho-CoA kinase [Bacteroidales bacterium]